MAPFQPILCEIPQTFSFSSRPTHRHVPHHKPLHKPLSLSFYPGPLTYECWLDRVERGGSANIFCAERRREGRQIYEGRQTHERTFRRPLKTGSIVNMLKDIPSLSPTPSYILNGRGAASLRLTRDWQPAAHVHYEHASEFGGGLGAREERKKAEEPTPQKGTTSTARSTIIIRAEPRPMSELRKAASRGSPSVLWPCSLRD